MAVEQAGQVGRKRKKIWLIRQNGERSMNQAVSSCRHSRFESECDSNAFRYRLLLLTQVLTATKSQWVLVWPNTILTILGGLCWVGVEHPFVPVRWLVLASLPPCSIAQICSPAPPPPKASEGAPAHRSAALPLLSVSGSRLRSQVFVKMPPSRLSLFSSGSQILTSVPAKGCVGAWVF